VIPSVILGFLQDILNSILAVFFAVWWLVLPLGLMFIFWQMWMYYIDKAYLRAQKWVLLEIKIPENIEKTPKAMEQVFAAFYQIYSYGLKFFEKYWEGHWKEDFISCEIIGHAGQVKFYVRTMTQYRNLVESAIYSQYPDAEISEAEDYRQLWPRTLPDKTYDIDGSDYKLVSDNPYPIRTYEYFEESQKEKRLDPIAAIVEVMSKLKEEEALWLQIFIRPVDKSWTKEGEKLVAELAGREESKPKTIFGHIGQFLRNLIIAAVEHPTWPEEEKRQEKMTMMLLTPGEREIIESVERKISKLAFATNIRFVFIDRRDSYSRMNVVATMASFQQFNALHLNGLMPRIRTYTLTPAGHKGIASLIVHNIKFIKRRVKWYRKRKLWDNYIRMKWARGPKSILNIEELATLFHVPSIVVEAPLLRKLAARKGEPPAGLPIQ
jgi:hypothetical protein